MSSVGLGLIVKGNSIVIVRKNSIGSVVFLCCLFMRSRFRLWCSSMLRLWRNVGEVML